MMKKYLILLVLFLLIIVFLWQGIFLPKDFDSAENKFFLIEKGQNLFQIAENLEEKGFIKNKFLFDFYVLLNSSQGKLQAGEYLFVSTDSMAKIAEKIISGKAIKTKITIIEGWSLIDIGGYLKNKGIFQAEQLYEMAELEGFLFPDTYEINPGMGITKIVEKMLNNFDKKLTPELREEIEKQNKTIFDIVIMASLIEKEVRELEDKKIVSGIFWKRIKYKIPLNSCATIAFILGGRNWTFEQMRKEIANGKEIDSHYNTYKYLGLPIGPICNPGLDSILAAVYPKDSEHWYYLSTPEGETIFSQTLEKHNIAKAKYLK